MIKFLEIVFWPIRVIIGVPLILVLWLFKNLAAVFEYLAGELEEKLDMWAYFARPTFWKTLSQLRRDNAELEERLRGAELRNDVLWRDLREQKGEEKEL